MSTIVHSIRSDWMDRDQAIAEVKAPTIQPWQGRAPDHVSMERDRKREADGVPCWQAVACWFPPKPKKA
jgi:hypothetical protein